MGIEETLSKAEVIDPMRALQSALEDADMLPITDRLQLLKQAEATVSSVLEGLDGL